MARLLGLGPEATQGAAHKKDERTFDRMPTESTMSPLSSGVLKGTVKNTQLLNPLRRHY